MRSGPGPTSPLRFVWALTCPVGAASPRHHPLLESGRGASVPPDARNHARATLSALQNPATAREFDVSAEGTDDGHVGTRPRGVGGDTSIVTSLEGATSNICRRCASSSTHQVELSLEASMCVIQASSVGDLPGELPVAAEPSQVSTFEFLGDGGIRLRGERHPQRVGDAIVMAPPPATEVPHVSEAVSPRWPCRGSRDRRPRGCPCGAGSCRWCRAGCRPG